MSKKVIRLITLILAVAMIASLAVGCGGNGDNPSSTPGGSSQGGDGMDRTSGLLPEVNPEDYRGTTVVYASWKDPYENEDKEAVEFFEEHFGINFELDKIDSGKYVRTLSARIAAGQQPDVFFENGDFPGSLTVMQPLDAAKLDLTDPFWSQAVIKASTLDGHTYLVDAVSNVWTEVDMCVYNKALFENNGLTSPAEYYAAGKWTFANFREAAKQIKALGNSYTGAGLLGESALGAAGCSVFTYKDNKMTVTIDDHFYEVTNFLAQMKKDGLAKYDREGFRNGKTGMALTNAFGLKKTGYFSTINGTDVGATYLPVWNEGDSPVRTGIYRGWGLVDGAKNPVAAGIFLRTYLDVNNYLMDKTFHNEEVTNFFFQLAGENAENMLYYHGPDMGKTVGGGLDSYHLYWDRFSPDAVKGALDKQIPVMKEACDVANSIIEKERKWIKETYGG